MDALVSYLPKMLSGAWVTIELVIITFVLGMLIGVPLSFAKTSRIAPLRVAATALIYFMRGTPLLAQLFLFYYGLGSLRVLWQNIGLWWMFRDSWYCALLVFTLNTACYQAEIFRASFSAISPGQREAAATLGLPRWVMFFKVLWPQALLIALGPLGNELIMLIKASAVASLVTVIDFMSVTKIAYARTFDFQFYLWAALFYLLLVELMRLALRKLNARLGRHLHIPLSL